MPIVLSKLEKLLNSNMFVIDTLFVYKSLCSHIRVLSILTGDSFVLRIDPEYGFKFCDDFSNYQFFKLSHVDFDSGETIVEKYLEYPDDNELQKRYKDSIQINDNSHQNLEDTLEDKYNYKISLCDITKPSLRIIKECFRQLKRLALATQSLRYKLCILKENYLSFTEQENVVKCYQINNFKPTESINVYVVVDLEFFYTRLSFLLNDLSTIKQSLYSIISKNHDTCLETTTKLVKNLINSISTYDSVDAKKRDIETSIERCLSLLETVNTHEKQYSQKYTENESNKQTDEIYVHEKVRLQNKLQTTRNTKKKILTTLVQLRNKKDNLYFTIDNIEFDNAIMLDGILSRISNLETLKL